MSNDRSLRIEATNLARVTTTAAMASLNHTNAIIFDWDNLGGYSGTVSLIAAYFFDHSGVHVRSTGKSDAAFFNPFAGCRK